MTVDEIFSSESEHLYFRLIAARNALNAATDSETVQVLNDILDETLNNISRIGTDEEIAAAEEIVVRKSNKTVKDYLNSKKFSLIATAVMAAMGLIAVLVLAIIIFGSNSSKVKPIITVVLFSAGVIGASYFVANYMKKKMNAAKASLKGKTVIGLRMRIDSEPKPQAKAPAASEKKTAAKTKTKGPKVVRNYFGFVKVIVIIGALAAAGIFIYTKRNDIIDGTKTILYNIGLYDPGDQYDVNKWKEIHGRLVDVKKRIYYIKAEELYAEAESELDRDKYAEASEMYAKCIGYEDAEAKSTEASNYSYYLQAKEQVVTDMIRARNILKNNIKVPCIITDNNKEVNIEKLIEEYNKYIDLTGNYGTGTNRFNIENFAKKPDGIYIQEKRMGWKRIETRCDREGYTIKVAERKGDEDYIYWYISKDNVVRVTAESEEVINK